jgi:hypothetical protein
MSRKAIRVVFTNQERVQVIQRFGIGRGGIASKQEPAMKRMSKQRKERKWNDEVFFFAVSTVSIQVAFVEAFSFMQVA